MSHPVCHINDLSHVYTDPDGISHASSRCEKAKAGGARVAMSERRKVGWLCSTCIDVSADRAHSTLHKGPDGKFIEGKGEPLPSLERRRLSRQRAGLPDKPLPTSQPRRPPTTPTFPNWRNP